MDAKIKNIINIMINEDLILYVNRRGNNKINKNSA